MFFPLRICYWRRGSSLETSSFLFHFWRISFPESEVDFTGWCESCFSFSVSKKKKTWNSVFQKVMYRFYRQAKMKRSSLKCRQNNNYMEHSFRESYQSILQTDVNSSLSVSIEKNGTQFSRKSWIDLTGWFESCLSFSVSKTKTSKETLHLLLFPFWKRYNLLYEWWKILISRYIWGPKTVSSLRDFRSTISFHSQNRELLAKSLSAYNQITSISREC